MKKPEDIWTTDSHLQYQIMNSFSRCLYVFGVIIPDICRYIPNKRLWYNLATYTRLVRRYDGSHP